MPTPWLRLTLSRGSQPDRDFTASIDQAGLSGPMRTEGMVLPHLGQRSSLGTTQVTLVSPKSPFKSFVGDIAASHIPGHRGICG